MAQDFDTFPIYDALTKDKDYMSDVWVAFMSTFYMNLVSYLTMNGILLPQLTQAQINAIQAPQNGQLLYNSSTNVVQVWQNGAWKTVTTS